MYPGPILLAVLGLLAAGANAQVPPAEPAAPTPAPVPPGDVETPAWSFGLSVYTYSVPDDREYVQPTFTADRDWLHLELRYNYEALDTGSAWVGYNFSFGEELTFEVTPMLGGVFGDTQGVAPGYKATLGWKRFEFYSEGEYLFDTEDSSDNFFYNWSQLTFAPTDNFRFGIVTQRTLLYQGEHEIERGLLVGIAGKNWDVTAHVFDLDAEPVFVLSFGTGF
jgi:hypothetical protein